MALQQAHYPDPVFTAATNAVPPTEPSAQLSYFSRSVLGELYHARSMLCPCHIAANLAVEEEKSVYPVFAFLLAAELIELVVPPKQQTYYLGVDEDLLESWELEQKRLEEAKVRGAERIRRQIGGIRALSSFCDRRDQWYRLFTEIGSDEVSPRYYLSLTRSGAKRFREESRIVA